MASFLSVCLLFLSVYTADGYLEYVTARCEFTSSELKDIQYIQSLYYNKLEYIRFDSSVEKFVGYTEHGVKNAERLNKDPSFLAQMRAEKETYCQHNVKLYEQETLPFSDPATLRPCLSQTLPLSGESVDPVSLRPCLSQTLSLSGESVDPVSL
ncbi:H-2 class II histocompatibility antigen I-E beta chain, partial [Dissostichus eleginoides]